MINSEQAITFLEQSDSDNDRFPLSPFPQGWYAAFWLDDIATDKLARTKVCGEEVIAFKDSRGEVHVLDAHCPHLGAHLGYGGTIKDDKVICPFHGWQYDCSGTCVEVPSAKSAPKASIKAWPVRVVNNMVMVWHTADKKPPTWFIEPIDLSEWTSPVLDRSCIWVIKSHVQEVGENGVDTAHFSTVHGANEVGRIENLKFDGAKASWRSFSEMIVKNEPVVTPSDVIMPGLGLQQVKATLGDKNLQVRTFVHITPVDAQHICIRLTISLRKSGNNKMDSTLFKILLPQLRSEIAKDFDIWENKRYLERPLYSPADGPIAKFRKWASQFYPSAEGDNQVYKLNIG